MEKKIAYIDGSSVGMYGYLLGEKVVISKGKELTNNQAEWNALLLLLSELPDFTSCKVYCDSMLVVNQFNCLWKIKDEELFKIFTKCKRIVLMKNLSIELVWIPREMNKFGKILDKELAKMRKKRWRNSKN